MFGVKKKIKEMLPPKEEVGIKGAEEIGEREIMGKYLLRDMPLFKYEIFAYFGTFAAFLMVSAVDRLGIVPGLTGKVFFPLLLVPIVVWFIKWAKYMPKKNRIPGMRIYKSGVVELKVEDLSKGYVVYGKGENAQRKYITKLNRHVEASTGRPFLVTSELRGENICLVEDSKPDMRSEEFNGVLELNTVIATKKAMARSINFTKEDLLSPQMILAFLTMGMVAFLLVKNLGFLPGMA